MKNLLEILIKEKPKFQVKSSSDDILNTEKYFYEGGRETSRFNRFSAALPYVSLAYIDSIINPDHLTLETGGGHSTIIFANKVKKHYCINPDKTANKLIREFLIQKECWTENIIFIENSSDAVLPDLKTEGAIDVALIDGNHSFPFPIIDWYYLDKLMKPGSILLLDNVEINSVQMLAQFLNSEPSYRLIKRMTNNIKYDCYVYQKVAANLTIGWGDQQINKSNLLNLSMRAVYNKLYKYIKKIIKSS